MRLKKLKLKNIRSYAEQEFFFPDGSCLLAGDVGSGKTSILLAIEYALFGLQPGQTGSALLRNNADVGEVSLEFEIEGKLILIERRLKRTKSVTNDYASYSINGEKIECSITELKTKIIELLGYPTEFIKKNNLLYKYTVYTPQEQMKQIISEEPEIRLNILRHIFGIDKYKTIRDNLNILLDDLKNDSKLIQGEISSLDSDNNRLLSTKSFISIIEKRIVEQEESVAENVKKRKEIERETLELEEKIKEKEKLEVESEKTKVLLTAKRESLAQTKKEQRDLERNILENKIIFDEKALLEIINQINEKSKEIEKNQAMQVEFSSTLNILRKRKSEAISNKERVFNIDICPTCLQNVPIAHKHNILNEAEQLVNSLTREIKSIEEKGADFLPLTEKIKKEKYVLEQNKTQLEIAKSKIPEIEKSKLKLNEISKSIENLDKDILLLSKHLDGLKENILNYSRFSNLHRIKQEELKKAFLHEKNSEISLAELKKELELTIKEVLLLESQIVDKQAKKQKLFNISELADWLSNHFLNLIDYTERNVMLKLRLEFSNLFSKWFSLLVQDYFDVQLDENFTPIIIQNGVEMDYSFLSGGERTAVALAYRLALNQIINSVMTTIKTRDIVILDEPTEGFSEIQIDKIRDILRELNSKQLILVSHEQKIEGFVDHILKIKKEGNESYLEKQQDFLIH